MAGPAFTDEIFLGRVGEQDRFRDILRDVWDGRYDEDLPAIMLIHGEGGMGKSRLIGRFHHIATREAEFNQRFDTVWLDWEKERTRLHPRRPPLPRIGRFRHRWITLLDANETGRGGFGGRIKAIDQ